MIGLIVAFFLALTADSTFLSPSEETDIGELRERYRLLVEERNRLLGWNRFLSSELRLALSEALYLVIHIRPPTIQLRAQATLLEEYPIGDFRMDRSLGERLATEGFLALRLLDLHASSSLSETDDEGGSTSVMDSLDCPSNRLYTIEFDGKIVLYVQHSIEQQRDGSGDDRFFLKDIKQCLVDMWGLLFSPRKALYLAMDEQDAMRLFRSLQIGMRAFLIE